MQDLVLQAGHTYRAKKPRRVGTIFESFVNDRTVIVVGKNLVQYDGPSVRIGRHYPRVSIESFLAWAERDVTEELPKDEYLRWEEYLRVRDAKRRSS